MINKATLNIIDCESAMTFFSDKELDFSDGSVADYVDKLITKAFSDENQKKGILESSSTVGLLVSHVRNGEISFVEFSKKLVQMLADALSDADEQKSYDIIVSLSNEDEVHYGVVLVLSNKTAFTHVVHNEQDGVAVEIMCHHAILPTATQKLDGFIFMNLDNYEVSFCDIKRPYSGKEVYVFENKLLCCRARESQKQVMKAVSTIANKVAEEFGSSSAKTMSRMKDYILENSENSAVVETEKLSRAVFGDSAPMRERFHEEIQKENIPESVPLTKTFAVKTSKSQKIKTDTGIEISFPPGYYENSRYMEFVNNPDGTISIEIKNIGKILNKG